jgi:hypothetical protein
MSHIASREVQDLAHYVSLFFETNQAGELPIILIKKKWSGPDKTTNNRRLDWDINTPTPYNSTHRLDWDINTAPHSPPTQSWGKQHRQRQPHTRAHKTAKGHRCQARMRAPSNSDFPKQPTGEPNEKRIDSPKRNVLTSHSCRAQGTDKLRLPILILCPASGFSLTFETFRTTKKGGSPHVIVAEPHPLT